MRTALHFTQRRRMLLGVVAATICVAPLCVTTPVLAQGLEVPPGSDVLGFTGTFTYTVDPASGVVHAELATDIKDLGEPPPSFWDCWRYFDILVPTTVTNIVNTGYVYSPDGTPMGASELEVRTKPIEGSTAYQYLRVEMMQCVWGDPRLHGYARVTFDIPGGTPRSDDPLRINSAFLGFDAFGIGYPTDVTINVVVPDSFTAIGLGRRWASMTEGGLTTYSLSPAEQLNSPDTYFSAANEDALVDAAPDTASPLGVMRWPDDAEWGQFVADQVKNGVPALSEAIGVDWPMVPGTEIVETYASTVNGTPGSFDPSSNRIALGEDLNPLVILYELSFAWFNEDWFSERWLNEGFAQAYSVIAGEGPDGRPPEPEPVSASDPGAVPLVMWGDPFFGLEYSDETETYGYNASYYVVTTLIDEIGLDKMRDVLRMVDSGATAYAGATDPELWNENTSWRELLDLLEVVGGSSKAHDLFAEFVVAPAHKDLLTRRDTSRASYDKLTDRGDPWAAPAGVRRALNDWDFDAFEDLSAEANAVLDVRDQLAEICAGLHIDLPSDLRTGYENAVNAQDLKAVADHTADYITATQALAAATDAEAASRDFFSDVGLLGSDTAGGLRAARERFAGGDLQGTIDHTERVSAVLGDAHHRGKVRTVLVAAIVAVILTGLGVTWFLRRRRRRRQQPLPGTSEVATLPTCNGGSSSS